jgi:hypothetical protein
MSEHEQEPQGETPETEHVDPEPETQVEPEPQVEPEDALDPDGDEDGEDGEDAAVAAPAAPTGAGMTEQEAEKIRKAAEGDWERFKARTVARWKGEGANLLDCPLCLDGHKGLVDVRDAGQYPKAIVDNVMSFLGLAREQDYKQSQSHNACSFCDANGKVATGSHVPEFTTVTCPECKGYGYTPPPTGNGTVTQISSAPSAASAGVPDDIQTGEIDNWGELRTLPDGRPNPNFGKQPSFKILVEPYGVTANLTATAAESV